jgi:hypothetical protein
VIRVHESSHGELICTCTQLITDFKKCTFFAITDLNRNSFYNERFIQAKDIFKGNTGGIILDNFVNNTGI